MKKNTKRRKIRSPQIQKLEQILKRNVDNEEERKQIDLIDQESYHYFFFDNIKPEDLEDAWSVFPEGKEIRKRLVQLEEKADVVPGFGYRLPGGDDLCTSDTIAELVRNHLRLVGPLVPEEDYNENEINFLKRDYDVVLAAPEIPIPAENPLFIALYEGIQVLLEDFPSNLDHYGLLYNWAIYLTKCDEVACYLLWPCMHDAENTGPEILEPAFRLWKYQCRNRYWIKNNDFDSGIVYFRPPWLDQKEPLSGPPEG